MIKQTDVSAAHEVLKKMNIALLEAIELTAELDSAIKTNDDVTVRMYLSERREEINKMLEYERILKKQCTELGEQDSKIFQDVIFAVQCKEPIAAELFEAAKKNKNLLLRLQKADKTLNMRMCKNKSIFKK